jgi:hypothetical protein
MDSRLTIGISAVSCFVAFGKVVQLYIWPRPQVLPRQEALNVVTPMFRFVGLAFLTPGIVSPDITAFANPGAYFRRVTSQPSAFYPWWSPIS